MNSEHASKEIVQSFIGLTNMAKGLMDENQQPSVQQQLRQLFRSARGGGRRGKSRELLRVGAGESSASATGTNNTSFTRSTTKGTKYGDQKQHQRNHNKSMSQKTTSEKTLSKFSVFSM